MLAIDPFCADRALFRLPFDAHIIPYLVLGIINAGFYRRINNYMRILNQINTKPIAIIHNGNTSVISRLLLNNSLNICNVPGSTFEEKSQYLLDKKSSCNFSAADLENATQQHDLYDIANNFYIIKAITSYDNDIKHLDDCWRIQDYTKEQYMHSLSYGLTYSDKILILDNIDIQFQNNRKNYIFSPGRSGSHLLLNQPFIDNSYTVVHHNLENKKLQRFDDIFNAAKLRSVIRKCLFDQITSEFMMIILGGTLLTTTKNYNDNVKIINNTTPAELDLNFCKDVFFNIISFTDWFLLLKLLLKKDITLSYFEDLSKDTGRWVKNPYNKSDLITNYSDIQSYVEINLQPLYTELLFKERIMTTL